MKAGKRAELLAPAGDLDSLKGAVNAGADAVYIGGEKFGARAYAVNFHGEELREALCYTHLHHSRLYLTVNTLLKEQELEQELYPYLRPLYEEGLDAVIVQDLGAMDRIHSWFPDLAIHVSTQMTCTGPMETRMLQERGATRVVMPRELSFQEIRQIYDQTGVEIESFVHGALCYCYSGQCLLSSMIGGRSGNRGRCAQPCRLPYEIFSQGRNITKGQEQYVLSPKDMCTLEILPQILQAGVYSLKIEGRMKKPEYTAGVVGIYRTYLDRCLEEKEPYEVDPADLGHLEDLFSRNGFHQSYYEQHNGSSMISLRKPAFRKQNQQLITEIKNQYLDTPRTEKVHGILILSKDIPGILKLQSGDCAVTVAGPIPQEARKAPLTSQELEERMKKTGGTPFTLDSLEIHMEDSLFLPVGAMNQWRRQALVQLEEEILRKSKRQVPPSVNNSKQGKDGKAGVKEKTCFTGVSLGSDLKEPFHRQHSQQASPILTAGVLTRDQWEQTLCQEELREVYPEHSLIWELGREEFCRMIRHTREQGKRVRIRMPYIFRYEPVNRLLQDWKEWEELETDGFVVRNLESLFFLNSHFQKTLPDQMVLDQQIYCFNRHTRQVLEEVAGPGARLTVPAELNSRELRELAPEGMELPVYGYTPLMVSAGCLKKTLNQCDHQRGWLSLKDRKKARFPVFTECSSCYNVLFNDKPLSLLDCFPEIADLHPRSLRLDFTMESSQETKEILDRFSQAVKGRTVQQLPSFTRGHFRRGVE